MRWCRVRIFTVGNLTLALVMLWTYFAFRSTDHLVRQFA
jgi:hypothetical protein